MRLLRTLLFVTVFWSLLTLHSFGMDTDLYTGSASGVKPNIVILYDNSGSMVTEVDTGAYYDPGTTYPTHPDHTDVVAQAFSQPHRVLVRPIDLYRDSILRSRVPTPDCSFRKRLYTGQPIVPVIRTRKPSPRELSQFFPWLHGNC
jgi:hypothetical protein